MVKNKCSTSDGQKKKSQHQFNVGNGGVLGGVVLLGGGLAVAGFVAAFTIIKNRNNSTAGDNNDQNNKEDSSASATATVTTAASSEKIHDASQGLTSVLQNPTTALHQNSCCANHVTTSAISHLDSRELVSAQNMALGDKPVPIMDGEKEDTSSYQQDISQLIETKKADEPAEPEILTMEDNLPNQSEDENGGGSDEHVMDREEEGEIIAPKGNSTMQPVEEEDQEREKESYENLPVQPVEDDGGDDEDDHDDVYNSSHDSSEGDVTEKEEESSEGTGSSSRESNVEAIWPTDMIEVLSHELKVMNASNLNSVEKMAKTEFDYLHNSKSDRERKNETTESGLILNKKTPQEFVISKVETINLPTREICVWTLLAVLLLLLLLHLNRKYPLQDLSYENSVVGPRV